LRQEQKNGPLLHADLWHSSGGGNITASFLVPNRGRPGRADPGQKPGD